MEQNKLLCIIINSSINVYYMKKKVFLLILLGTLFGKSLAQSNKDFWVKRYVSVSYPLKINKINSWFGYRRDPFTFLVSGTQQKFSAWQRQAY